MKTTNIFAMTVLAMAGLSACNNDEPSFTNFPDDGVVRFQVGVNEAASRASHSTDGSSVTNFGICITNSENFAYTYNNKEVTGSNTAGWTVKNGPLLWQNATQAVDIVAYSPFKRGEYYTATTNFPVEVEATQTAQSYASDFLYCKKAAFVPSNAEGGLVDGKLNLEFEHALSLLNIEFTLGTEYNKPNLVVANPFTKVSVNGTVLKGTCIFTDGTITPTADAAAATAAYNTHITAATDEKTNAVVGYQCILVPQSATLEVEATMGEKTFTWKGTEATALAKGQRYTLKLKIGKDMVQMGAITATPWDTSTEQNEQIETE